MISRARTVARRACIALLAVVATFMLLVAWTAASCFNKHRSTSGVEVDREFSARIFHGDRQGVLDEIRSISIHVVPQKYGLLECFSPWDANTRMATLAGASAAGFLSHAMAEPQDERRPGCPANTEKVKYHVLVRRKGSDGVGHFIVGKCSADERNTAEISYEHGPDGDTRRSYAYSDELHSLLSLRADNSAKQPSALLPATQPYQQPSAENDGNGYNEDLQP